MGYISADISGILEPLGLTIRAYNREKVEQDDDKPLKISQLVLIMDINVKRAEWHRNIVVDISKCSDGRVRSVRTAKRSLIRPVSKLVRIKNYIVNSF